MSSEEKLLRFADAIGRDIKYRSDHLSNPGDFRYSGDFEGDGRKSSRLSGDRCPGVWQ